MAKPSQDAVNAMLLSNDRVIMEALIVALTTEIGTGMREEAADRLRSQIQQTAAMAVAVIDA